jgi:hypothetical protein
LNWDHTLKLIFGFDVVHAKKGGGSCITPN